MANFISINNVRIRKNNIKNFGVSFKRVEYSGGIIISRTDGLEAVKVLDEVGRRCAFAEVSLVDKAKAFVYGAVRKTENKDIRYLYVTTYQSDNFIFYENEIKIDTVLRELESI